MESPTPSQSIRTAIVLMRPKHWAKNSFVLLPLLFSGRASDPQAVVASVAAFLVFCLVASGTYAWNDVLDRVTDQQHPTKRYRPVASGRSSVRFAVGLGVALVMLALGAAWLIAPAFAIWPSLYVVLTLAYSFWFKGVVILDVFVIGALFVLRLLGGASAVEALPSVWLLVCSGLLALFLGFSKRRHEVVLIGANASRHRPVLDSYSVRFLDQALTVLMTLTVISYIMYTLVSESGAAMGAGPLTFSAVFVLYGVLRYALLVEDGGGDPVTVLFTDRPLLLNIALWTVWCMVGVYRG